MQPRPAPAPAPAPTPTPTPTLAPASTPADPTPSPRLAQRWLRSEPPPLSFTALGVAMKLGDAGVSVKTVATRFPHVLNRVGAAWDDPATVSEVMQDLMVDQRGGRRGFPPEALEELKALHVVCATRAASAPNRPSPRRRQLARGPASALSGFGPSMPGRPVRRDALADDPSEDLPRASTAVLGLPAGARTAVRDDSSLPPLSGAGLLLRIAMWLCYLGAVVLMLRYL